MQARAGCRGGLSGASGRRQALKLIMGDLLMADQRHAGVERAVLEARRPGFHGTARRRRDAERRTPQPGRGEHTYDSEVLSEVLPRPG